MISRTNIVLSALLIITVLLAATSGVDYSVPNVELLADTSMKYTPASTAYEANEVFADGKTQQPPIPGTIARGEMPLHFADTPENADPKDAVPGKGLQNPFSLEALIQQATLEYKREEAEQEDLAKSTEPAGAGPSTNSSDPSDNGSKEISNSESVPDEDSNKREPPEAVAHRLLQNSINQGSDVFGAFCICCHGPSGKGDGLVAQRGYPPPQSFLTGTSRVWTDGQLFHIVTYGRANMPQFAAEIPRNRRWDVINYIRSLQKGAPPVEQLQVKQARNATASPLDPKANASEEANAEPSQKAKDASSEHR